LALIPENAETIFLDDNEYIYFKAICFKKMRQLESAEEQYVLLRPALKKSEGNSLVQFVFGMTLLPLQSNRKLVDNYLENFVELLNLYGPYINYCQAREQDLLDL